MANRYIEVNSLYRNRNLYPQPASFTVKLSESGQGVENNALDPVCDSAPILTWNNSFREEAAANTITSITISPTTTPSNMGTDVFEVTTTQNFRQVTNFYVGCMLRVTVDSNEVVRRIAAFKPLNLTTAMITLEEPLPDGAIGATGGSITNPTPIATTTADSVIRFYIPTGSFIDNFYVNYYVETIGPTLTRESRLITAYDGITRLATLASATTSDWASNGNANQNFVIRKELPINNGTLVAVSSDGRTMQLATTASTNSGLYVGGYIRMTEPFPVVPYSTEVAPYGEQRRITKYLAGSGRFSAFGGAGTATFTLSGNNLSTENDFYVNAYITNTTTGETRQIATYNGITKSGTVTANWGAGAAGNAWSINTVFLQSAFSTNPVIGAADTYEIEKFTRDNSNPLSYNGSMVSQQEEVCYEVELLNLILPNLLLSSGRGGRVAFYPYIYVKFEPSGSSSQGKRDAIYSNNPNAKHMLFRVPVDDTPTPLISPFIKVDGDGMTHTMKFKPNQDFNFAVYHQTGELFTTVAQDYYAPSEPNPLVQISACFMFKRV